MITYENPDSMHTVYFLKNDYITPSFVVFLTFILLHLINHFCL